MGTEWTDWVNSGKRPDAAAWQEIFDRLDALDGGGGGGGTAGYAIDLANPGANTVLDVPHGLSNEDVGVFLRRKSDGKNMEIEWRVIDSNTVRLTFEVAPVTNIYRVVVVPT